MIRSAAIAAAAFAVLMIDGDSHVVPRQLECLTTASGEPVTLHLRGDRVFSDGFESGTTGPWRQPPDPCGDG